MNYAQHFNTKRTPQSEPVPGKGQVENSAGGFVFAVDDWVRLERFLILGSDGGSYYAGERKLTRENAECVARCVKEDGRRAVAVIASVSRAGRAPKNAPAVFALALAASLGDIPTRVAALDALPRVARTGTDLFAFAEAADGLRGWGKAMVRGVSAWYTSKSARDLAYQVTKYQERNGWSHKDVLRLCHVKADDPSLQAVLRWVRYGADLGGMTTVRKEKNKDVPVAAAYGPVEATLPGPIEGFERVRLATHSREVARLIEEYGLVREVVPTQWLNEPAVWEALLPRMPLTAVVRNLAKMTSIGLLAPLSDGTRLVCEKLGDVEAMRRARVHPLSLLVALNVYGQGKGDKGSLTWTPVPQVVDALDRAFYAAFAAVKSTGKNWLLALDVSGSMESPNIAGMPGVTPRVGSAAMALVTAATEPNHHVVGFSHRLVPVPVSPRQRLSDAVDAIGRIPMGGTDCALPMIYATQNRLAVDAFVVYTDSETWHGGVHPFQALKDYRQKMGRPAKLVVVGMVASQFSIADPSDAGMLDVVGFDTAAPAVMADFVGGGQLGVADDAEE